MTSITEMYISSKKFPIFLLFLYGISVVCCEEIHTTKVFFMPIGPCFFNWNSSKDTFSPNQVQYTTSLVDSPDLPSWMYYSYSGENNTGFLYGVPPVHQKDFQVEVIGLNKKKFEARRKVVNMKVIEKEDKAKYEVQMKIDKLNVQDLFKYLRYNYLLNIFKHVLWKESADDLYVTFIASAVALGARLPLNPDEGEGVVIHLGSQAEFSIELKNLEKEIQPLRIKKYDTCPGFKAMSVERFFRHYNFSLDWCAFKMININSVNNSSEEVWIDSFIDSSLETNPWNPPQRDLIPTRDYTAELTITMITPCLAMIVLIILLSFILYFQHEGISKRNQNTPDVLMVQYESIQRVSKTLRSMSSQRDNDKFLKSSPRLSDERSSRIRPNPPPYSSIRQNVHGDF
uniref:Dystroglycan-type cadherin-like domain-containing protein n=1 Tax=Clastoptera arizonana TaxID=38151 RepID=A0A1B6CP38_9HEMI